MSSDKERDPISETALPVNDIFVNAPGGMLFARIWGSLRCDRDHTPIILFHDSLGCVELWRDFPATLASTTGLPVIAYDRLGFGKSDPHPGTLEADFIRDEARSGLPALRNELELGRMILFGHSVGGAMAVATGAAFPDVSAAVVTESAQAFVEDRTIAGIREAQTAFKVPGQLDRLARYHGNKARWVLDAWIETWLSTRFATWTLDDELRRLRCPILAMHGDRDEYGSRLHLERIVTVPGVQSKMVIFEQCGHVPHREKPQLVLRAVTEFLEALR
jgi:pimeloyl-ACP methyl ester carboxylesterase